ncbi:MAG TPA: DUF2993 domain-containing protein [Jatrophihabitans sp.]|jgi:hypothetical protein|nr:DUF2993 domain-containing protein [Jatrophihabitans sp.]
MSTRAVRVTAIVVAVVLVLLLVIDRGGDYVAERLAGDTIESAQDLNSRPDVNIAGFPFLNQLVTGKYDKITVTAHDVSVGTAAVPLDVSQVQVVLHTLTVSRNFHKFHADSADATATVTYAELSDALGIQVGYAGGGRVRASKTFTLAGASAKAAVTTRPTLSDGALSFTSTTVENAGALSAAVSAALNHVFDVNIPLQQVRFDVRVRRLAVDDSGLTLELTGHDLAYSR